MYILGLGVWVFWVGVALSQALSSAGCRVHLSGLGFLDPTWRVVGWSISMTVLLLTLVTPSIYLLPKSP